MESLYLIIRKADGHVFTGFHFVSHKMVPGWASSALSAAAACYFTHAAIEEAVAGLAKHVPIDSFEVVTFQRVS